MPWRSLSDTISLAWAYAFALIVTLAVNGESSAIMLASRAWETLIGGALGLTATMILSPLRMTAAR